MKKLVKRSVITLSLISIFAYAVAPENVNNYETKIDIHVKKINKN